MPRNWLSTVRKMVGAVKHKSATAAYLLLGVVMACSQDDLPTAPSATDPLPLSAFLSQLDSQIDPTDSYVVATITSVDTARATSATPLYNPATGGTATSVTIPTPPDSVGFQTGFNTAGAVVAVTQFAPEPNLTPDPNEVSTSKIVGNVATDYNASGQPVYDTPAEVAAGPDPITELPAITGSVLIDALVPPPEYDPPADPPGGGGTCLVDCPPNSERSLADLSSRAPRSRVELKTATALKVVTEVSTMQAGNVKTTGRIRHSYKKQDGRWMIDQIESESVVDDGLSQSRSSHVLKFSNVRYFENKDKDKVRRDKAKQGANVPAQSFVRVHTPVAVPAMDICEPDEPDCNDRDPVNPPAPPPPCDKINSRVVDASQAAVGPGLVMQHGIWSDACTWERLYPYVTSTFVFGSRVKISTNSIQTYDFQRDELRTAMNAGNGHDYVIIGHSNGGIVGRRVGQIEKPINPGKIRGVLTIDSPHQGGPAMATALHAVYNLANVLHSIPGVCPSKRGCGELEMMGGLNSVVAKLDAFAANPLYPQMTPNNPFRTALNAAPDPFLKVGIVSHSDGRWVWARMFGDNRCAPELDCGGRNTVKRTQRFHKHAAITALISGLLTVGFAMIQQPILMAASLTVYIGAVTVLAAMDAFDLIYHLVVSPGDQSDGLAPVRSQEYPYSDRDYHILHADSHVGATRSDMVQSRVFDALFATNLFHVAKR
jgi:pimeloyl-ACP methyl ester carboxylesterase